MVLVCLFFFSRILSGAFDWCVRQRHRIKIDLKKVTRRVFLNKHDFLLVFKNGIILQISVVGLYLSGLWTCLLCKKIRSVNIFHFPAATSKRFLYIFLSTTKNIIQWIQTTAVALALTSIHSLARLFALLSLSLSLSSHPASPLIFPTTTKTVCCPTDTSLTTLARSHARTLNTSKKENTIQTPHGFSFPYRSVWPVSAALPACPV